MAPETVQLSAEVTVGGLNDADKEKYEQFSTLFDDGYYEFVDKNQSYGDTFIKNGVVAYIEHPDKYESMSEACIEQVMVRIGDKRSRIDNLVVGNGDDKVGEAVAETAGDAANYYRMVEWLAEYGDEMIPKLLDIEPSGRGNNLDISAKHLYRVMDDLHFDTDTIEQVVDGMYGVGTYESEVLE